ncbi:hypothetical protein AXG93_2490s1130 [Marchantia polymorpha subsp. ruderalis]|uniref:NADP-dependent oxidoreductase domain-containing protein n=1 Tax=Marchantia polymorpha subsp. ruderalis TaxID=1480154 RepID=A0A176W6H3_MARPO|nr:hypothetical protein AXG93_2490s1130 [Marchantia polymorpha subsp. ruderalis]
MGDAVLNRGLLQSGKFATHLSLNNAVTIPRLGLGTHRSTGEDVKAAVLWALQSGYRHIDTASIYKNETEIGQAVRDSGVARESLFITSKVSPYEQGFECALASVGNILQRLDCGYLDLCLIHWPGAAKLKLQSEKNRELRQETWRALEKLYDERKCRAIGKDIVVEAYSPLGVGNLLTDPVVCEIAARRQRTPAQILLRWGLQQNVVVLPKSVKKERIKENIDVFGFSLSDEEMATLNGLDRNHHFCWSPDGIL